MDKTTSEVQVRIHGSPALPSLIYLPGIHGDWTLVSSFRQALNGKLRFVEVAYPRTTSWSLDDYAAGIEKALRREGIAGGWLLGESFGSQPAWVLAGHGGRGLSGLSIDGLVLAGGFVKHPWPWGAKLLRFMTRKAPRGILRPLLQTYAACARLRHRQAPDTLAAVGEFVLNRLHPDDPAAWVRRYSIVADSDVRAVAAMTRIPVFHLAGLFDPIVPGLLVRRWLRKNCPGYRTSKTLCAADHNVLGTAPSKSAAIILGWMAQSGSSANNGEGGAAL
jgi:pimeloyl-ACP methyl ester carboxylesterase